MQNSDKVPFDPGFSEFSVKIPVEAPLVLDQIAKLKQPHQKKFEFQKFEMQLTPVIKNCVAVYLGCILWGSYLYHRYKEEPKEIYGNIIKELPEEQREKFDYSGEIEFVIGFIEKINKASNYYLRKPSRIRENLITYCQSYKEFLELNNNFKCLDKTNEIRLPAVVSHFENYDVSKLEELKTKIEEIINSDKIDRILELGFYK